MPLAKKFMDILERELSLPTDEFNKKYGQGLYLLQNIPNNIANFGYLRMIAEKEALTINYNVQANFLSTWISLFGLRQAQMEQAEKIALLKNQPQLSVLTAA